MSFLGRRLNKQEVLKRTALNLMGRRIGCVIKENAIIIRLGKYNGHDLGRARLSWLHGKREWVLSHPFPASNARRIRCDDYEMALLEITAIQVAAKAGVGKRKVVLDEW